MQLVLTAVGDGRTAELPFGSVVIRAKRMAGAGVMEVFTPDTTVPLRCGMQLTLARRWQPDFFRLYLYAGVLSFWTYADRCRWYPLPALS